RHPHERSAPNHAVGETEMGDWSGDGDSDAGSDRLGLPSIRAVRACGKAADERVGAPSARERTTQDQSGSGAGEGPRPGGRVEDAPGYRQGCGCGGETAGRAGEGEGGTTGRRRAREGESRGQKGSRNVGRTSKL